MKGFSLPAAPEFMKQAGNFQELTGKGVASFLKGLGIDLTQVVPIAQGMFNELEKLNARLEAIEKAIEPHQETDMRLEAIETAIGAQRADLDALGEIVRETVPEAAVSIGEYEKTLHGGEHGRNGNG